MSTSTNAIATTPAELVPILLSVWRRLSTIPWYLTLRGMLVTLFAAYLVLFPARLESDMIASILGYSLLTLVVLSLIATVVQALRFRNSLRIAVSGESSSSQSSEAIAREATRIVTRLSPVSVIPFTILEIELEFFHPLTCARHLIAGRSKNPRILIEDIVFPHRGHWALNRIKFRISDWLGLSSRTWEDSECVKGLDVTIHPPSLSLRNVPVISSAVRTGDALSDVVERHGDPFDLKQYHPADGVRRILWKVFAKRGELIARHPERAVSPEGQVVSFVIADAHDDHVCRCAINYAHQLAELDLQLWFGCEGQSTRAAARNASHLEQLLIDSVWDTHTSDASRLSTEIIAFLNTIQSSLQHSRIEKVIIFLSEERCSDPAAISSILAALNQLAAQAIIPVLILVRDTSRVPQRLDIPRWLSHLLFKDARQTRTQDPEVLRNFLSVCASRGWEVII